MSVHTCPSHPCPICYPTAHRDSLMDRLDRFCDMLGKDRLPSLPRVETMPRSATRLDLFDFTATPAATPAIAAARRALAEQSRSEGNEAHARFALAGRYDDEPEMLIAVRAIEIAQRNGVDE